MKKGLLFFLTIVILLSACKKDNDYAFDKSPDERINEALAAYQTKLVAAENGWRGLITVDSGRGGTYSFYFKFNDQNRVTMVSDFDSASAATPKESSYRLKAQQQPTLIFDTYSYLHVLADPNEGTIDFQANVNDGDLGEGLLSDFEFIFDNSQIKEDTIRMNGKVHGAKLVLVKASKAEADAYLGGQFSLFSDYITKKILTYFERLTIGTQLYDISVNNLERSIIFRFDAAGTPHTFSTHYYNGLNMLLLQNPLITGAQTISGFNNPVWDPLLNKVTLSSGGQPGSITSVVVPLYTDKQAPDRWWQYGFDRNDYWSSRTGFHINGKDDWFNIQSLGNYYHLAYWPDFGSGADLFGPIFVNAARTALELRYGAAPAKPTVTTDGRAVFTDLGNYTFGSYPFVGPARQSRSQLFIPEGYYFVQINDKQYDMVSAANGLAWISWRF